MTYEDYRRFSAPKTQDEAKTASEAFVADVTTAREKHGIPDVVVITRLTVRGDDGETGDADGYFHLGDPERSLFMVAQSLGRLREKWRLLVSRMAGGTRDP